MRWDLGTDFGGQATAPALRLLDHVPDDRGIGDPSLVQVDLRPHDLQAALQFPNSRLELVTVPTDRWTPAVFIGEPTGSSPQFWGDHRIAELENSGIDVSASPTWLQPGGPYDERAFLPPLLAFEPRFADYAAGRDSALEAALAWEEQELDLEAPVRAVLSEGGTEAHEAIAAAVRAWDANPVHRYQPATGALNRAGYALLHEGRSEDALSIFRLNVELHPDYANGWDSLGDALLRAGRREEGLVAYQRAYELDPEVGTAAAVLEAEGRAH